MAESILTSVKKVLGIAEDYEEFDLDITMHINSTFATLNQIGIGPPEGFMIEDSTPIWSDYIGDQINLNSVKTYIYIKVRLLFDPPANSFTQTAYENQAKELEWRLNVVREGVLHPWAEPSTIS